MVKYGLECPAEMQLCLNHGLHLAICDTFYSNITRINDESNFDSENESENIDDLDTDIINCVDNDEDFSFSEECEDETVPERITIADILEKKRAIVKKFKVSTVRNDILQQRVSKEVGHEVSLELDVKHRWNSIHPMLQKFLKLQKPIEDALKVLNATHLFTGIDLKIIEDLCNILKPLELTVLALGRKDENLFSANKFVYKNIDYLKEAKGSSNFQVFINKLDENIKTRLGSRENQDFISLLNCLLQQKLPTKDHINFGTRLSETEPKPPVSQK